MIGLLDCESEALPRIRMRAPAPLAPLDGDTVTPGTRAESASDGVWIGADCSSLRSTRPTVLPSFLVSTAPPVPVTTTWSSWSAERDSWKSARTVALSGTVTGAVAAPNPMSRTRTLASPTGALTMR